MRNFYSNIYHKLDKNKTRYTNKFKNVLRSPIDFYMEFICRKYIWRDFIVKEMITTDNVFAFLDDNDFEYNGTVFRKMDVIQPAHYYDRSDYEESKYLIRKDYIENVINLLNENFSFDIAEYITLLVDVRVQFTQSNGERYRAKVYEVIIQYCREKSYQRVKRNLILFLSILFILLVCISILKIII